MNKLYFFFLTHKKRVLFGTFVLAFVLAVIGYALSPKINGFEVFNKSISIFAFDWIEETNAFLIAAQFFAIVSVFLGVAVLFLKDLTNDWLIYSIQKDPFTLVVGLGEQNRAFLNSLDRNSSVIIIEKDKNNPYIELFRQRDFGVIVAKAEEVIEKLSLSNLKNAVISTSNSSLNISIASMLADRMEDDKRRKLFVRIENRDLGVLFKRNVIKKKRGADIVVYSIYENMAKALFNKHSVLGNMIEIADRKEEFCIAVVGDSSLSSEIVYHLSVLSSLPNQNPLTLYLVGERAFRFYEKIKKLFWNIEKIDYLKIEPIEIDSDSFRFYEHEVWRKKNLTNIIIATDDGEKNLDIAINLQDTVFLRDITKGDFKTKVLFAVDFDRGLAKQIDRDKELFANFFTFGSIEEASSRENLVDEELDLIAKSIHYLYKEIKYDPDFLVTDENMAEVERRWYDIETFSDKLSNKMQALHIDTKLSVLRLRKVKSDKDKRELLRINKEIFFKRLGKRYISDEELREYSKKLARFYTDKGLDIESIPPDLKPLPLPKSYDSLFEKLIRSEHNRWMAYHYLNGWEYGEKKDKRSKIHCCLVPFDKLDYTVIFDIYSVVYIPNFLASAGYEIVDI